MNAFLETGISLVLLFFVFSIITYIIQELIAVNLKFRSKMLWRSLEHLLDDNEQVPLRASLLKALPKDLSKTEEPAKANDAEKKEEAVNTKHFYRHAQIVLLQRKPNRKPSYIPAANFALAIMDIVAGSKNPRTGNLYNDIKNGLQAYTDNGGKFGDVLKTLLETSSTIQELQTKIEAWYNRYMQRVTGWYEAHTVASVRIIALVLALVFNVNVISLSKTIYKDAGIRGRMVAMAENMVNNADSVLPYYSTVFEKKVETRKQYYAEKMNSATGDTAKKNLQTAMDRELDSLANNYDSVQRKKISYLLTQLDSTGLPLGWSKNPVQSGYWENQGPTKNGSWNFALALLGWLIAAGCFSMGAPFWFDMMGKLVNVRRSGIKPNNVK